MRSLKEEIENVIRRELGESFLQHVKDRADELDRETEGMSRKERDEYLKNKMAGDLRRPDCPIHGERGSPRI